MKVVVWYRMLPRQTPCTGSSYMAVTTTVAGSAAESATVHNKRNTSNYQIVVIPFLSLIESDGPLSNIIFIRFGSKLDVSETIKFSFLTSLRDITEIQRCLPLRYFS